MRRDIRSGIFLFEMSKNKLFSCDVFTSKIVQNLLIKLFHRNNNTRDFQ